MNINDILNEAVTLSATDTDIRNCKFAFKCPKRWEQLQIIRGENPDVRHCRKCEQRVFFCRSDEELAMAIRANRCVAIPTYTMREDETDTTLGLPADPDGDGSF